MGRSTQTWNDEHMNGKSNLNTARKEFRFLQTNLDFATELRHFIVALI